MKLINLFIYIYLLFIYGCESTTKPNNHENIIYIDNISDNSFDIMYKTSVPIAGFQFLLSGIDITGLSNLISEEDNFSISYGPLAIVGFSLDGSLIPSGNNLLLTVHYIKTDFISCISDLVIVDINSNILGFEVGECLDIGCSDLDFDLICDEIDLCIGEIDTCGICNGLGLTDSCDCYGNIDSDFDGICDNIDVCIGQTSTNGYSCIDIHVLDDFRNLNYRLKELDIHELGIQFWENGRLERLYLLNLNITDIPHTINNFAYLKKLYLDNNNISVLPESLSYLERLEDLMLDNNEIIELPASLEYLTHLENLSLNENKINYLPENIGNNILLERLELKNNNLINLPESITNLYNLEKLWLDNNSLISLPQNLCNLVGCDIDVNGNNLCEVFYFNCIDDWLEQDCE